MKATVRLDATAVMAGTRAAAARAVTDAAEYLLEEANRTAPIEEATLIGSGHVGKATAHDLVATVSYDTPYAVRQHEDTRLRHDPGRRAKWLQHTFREQQPRILAYLADRMKSAQ